MYPGAQKQVYELTLSTQVPLLRQGFVSHSLISKISKYT